MKEFEKCWPEGFNEKIPNMVKTQANAQRYIKVGESKVYDTELIYTRVIGLQASSREFDVKQLLCHELAPIPTSMFTETGEMRVAKAKSALKNALMTEVSTTEVTINLSTSVIDGSAVLYCIRWPTVGTVMDYVVDFRKYIERKLVYRDIYLVFDRYKDYSTKSATRAGRGASQEKARLHNLSTTMQMPKQKTILAVPENKKQLIAIIVEDLTTNLHFPDNCSPERKLVVTGQNDTPVEITRVCNIQRQDLRTSHEEADNIIVQQVIYVAKATRNNISVISDDTDVFLLLMYHYAREELSVDVIMESVVQGRATIDIKSTVNAHKSIIPDILAAHALSGCDTTACYFGIGKGTVLKVLKSGAFPIPAVGDTSVSFDIVLEQSTKFVSAFYGITAENEQMSNVRQRIWALKVGKSPSAAPKLCMLPPTSEAFVENVKRAHLQTCIWKTAVNADPPNIDPASFGWEKNDKTMSFDPIMLPKHTKLAPASVLQLIKCSCESQMPCSTLRCRCSRSGLPCTIFCVCQGCSFCCNDLTKHT